MPSCTFVDFFDYNITQKPTYVGAGSGWIKLKGIFQDTDSGGIYYSYASKEEAYALLLVNKLYKLEYAFHITDQYGGTVENWTGVMPMMQVFPSIPTGFLAPGFSTLGFYTKDEYGQDIYISDGNMYVNCIENWKENGEIDQVCKSIKISGGITWNAGNYGTKANGNVIYTNPGPVPGPYGDVTIPDNYFIDSANIPHYIYNGTWDLIKFWEISMGARSPVKEYCVFNASIGIGQKYSDAYGQVFYYAKLDFSTIVSPIGAGSIWAISSDPNYLPVDSIYGPRRKIDDSKFDFNHTLELVSPQVGNYSYKTIASDTSCFYFWGDPNYTVTCNMKLSNVHGFRERDKWLTWRYE